MTAHSVVSPADWAKARRDLLAKEKAFTKPEMLATGTVTYNYAAQKATDSELPGLSVFFRDDDGTIFHTYSCYARGLDMRNGAYRLLDLTPKGRDEGGLPYPMAWLELHDEYESRVELRR